MAIRVVIHVRNSDPFVAVMESMPAENATYIIVKNPTTREGRPVDWARGYTNGYLFPLAQIMFMEFPVSGAELDDVQYHVREKSSRG